MRNRTKFERELNSKKINIKCCTIMFKMLQIVYFINLKYSKYCAFLAN